MSNRKPKVLLAARPVARAPFRKALGEAVDVVEAETMEQAVAELKDQDPPSLVCCTVYFDESRMFDLLRWVRAMYPQIPIVCARAMPKDITKVSMEAVRIAATALGATAFVDVPALAAEHGADESEERLRLVLFSQLSSAG